MRVFSRNDSLSNESFIDYSEFGNKAIELGATVEDIEKLFNNTVVPKKYQDKLVQLSNKKLNTVAGKVSQAVLDAGYDINFLPHNNNAITMEGKDSMRRNGRKWTNGFKSILTAPNGDKLPFEFDIIMDEGVDNFTNYYVLGNGSSIELQDGFRGLTGWTRYGVREFVSSLKKILNNYKK